MFFIIKMEKLTTSQQKKISINTGNARHEKALLSELIRVHKWQEIENKDKVKQSDIYFLHPSVDILTLIKENNCIFQNLPGVNAASNKRRLAQIFSRL